ncbi:MAG: hypothetical protein MSA38_04335 [Bacteroidales bacterium]|nr:hypothetical protein [Bacteroidales bacterium]
MALPPAAPHIAAFSLSGIAVSSPSHCRKQILALPPSALGIAASSPSHCRKQPHTARNYDSGIISQRIYDSKADTMWTTALT